MKPADALAAVALFARATGNTYRPDGENIYANAKPVGEKLDTMIRARMQWQKGSTARPAWKAKLLKVDGADINVIHQGLTYNRVCYHIRNFDKTTKLDESNENKEPCLVQFRGKLVMWNGHHRLLAARLLGRALPCVFYNLDWAEAKRAYAAHKVWERKHGDIKRAVPRRNRAKANCAPALQRNARPANNRPARRH